MRRLLEILRLRLRSLARRMPVETELDDEMRFHLDRLVEAKIAEGLPAKDARAAALREFGNPAVLQEDCRDARGVAWIENLIRDTRYGWRALIQNPAFALTAVLSLALGIGGAMSVFAIIEAVMLRSLPVHEPQELVTIDVAVQGQDKGMRLVDFQRLVREVPVFQATYAAANRNYVRVTANGDRKIDQIAATQVTHEFFAVLGLRPPAGRFFAPEDDQTPNSAKTAGSVVVISYDFWEREFGRDPNAIGKTLTFNQADCRIIGVAPQGFFGDTVGEKFDLWTPFLPFVEADRVNTFDRPVRALRHMGRLKPDVSRTQAETQLTAAYQQMQTAMPASILFTRDEKTGQWQRYDAKPVDYHVRLADGALGFDLLRTRYRQPLLLMLGATMLVFLTGCANVANLLLTRGVLRRHEVSIRQALGAGRGRIVTQLLTECLLLAAIASAAGLALGQWGSATLVSLVDIGRPPSVGLHQDWRVGLFLCGLMLVAILLFGLGPAWRQSKVSGSRTAVGRSHEWPHRALIVGQVAMSIILLSSAALLGQTIRNLRNQDFGYKPAQLISITFRLDSKETSNDRTREAGRRLLQRVEAIPGVTSAATSASGLFGDSNSYQTIPLPGRSGEGPLVRIDYVSPRYFETIGVPLVAGRAFQDVEDVPVAIVNETFARKFLAGKDPVGMKLDAKKARRIVGMVRDARYNSARIDYEPAIFAPQPQDEWAPRRIEVRTAADPQAVIGMIRAVVRETDRDIVIERVSSLTADIDRSFQRELLLAKLVSAFSALALTLSCIGLYGMMSYSVSRRVNEFGVRMALGARPGQLLGLVLRDSGVLILCGVVLGIPCAWMASRLIESFLFGVQPTDPRTVLGVALLLTVAGLGAALIPARRAALVDPATALRSE